jgi:molybdate transport system substrate-binding protein
MSRLARVMVAIALAVAGCSDSGTADTTLVVSAASSLSDVFAAEATAFESAHPGIEVRLNTGASSTLREQILAGADVDVFAAADRVHLDAVTGAGLAPEPVAFASSGLVIAVPAGNPGGVTGLADFARDDLVIGLCVPAAPCGDLARRALRSAGVEARPDTEEPNVRALVTKIAAGELDAGLVYETDVMAAAGALEAIPLPATVGVRAVYWLAPVAAPSVSTVAEEFVAFVMSQDGRALLYEYGFGSP